MGLIILGCAIFLFVVALCFYAYLAATSQAFSLNAIWELCVKGNRAARTYFVLTVVAFILAVASQIILMSQHKNAKKLAFVPLAAAPNPALQRSAFGAR